MYKVLKRHSSATCETIPNSGLNEGDGRRNRNVGGTEYVYDCMS